MTQCSGQIWEYVHHTRRKNVAVYAIPRGQISYPYPHFFQMEFSYSLNVEVTGTGARSAEGTPTAQLLRRPVSVGLDECLMGVVALQR